VLVALAPHLLVFVWTQLDRPVPGQVWGTSRDAMEEGRGALPRGNNVLDSVAKKRGVRLRVVRTRDRCRHVRRRRRPSDRFRRAHRGVLLATRGRATLRQLDGRDAARDRS